MDRTVKQPQTSREIFSKWRTLAGLRLSCALHTLFDFGQESVTVSMQNNLLDEINRALCTLRAARSAFSEATDPDLIEALIYEMKTAEAQYNFLLKKAKESGLTQIRSAR